MVLCNSSSAVAEMITHFNCNQNRVKLIRNPIEVQYISERARRNRQEFRKQFGSYILAVERLEREKGTMDLLEAYAMIKNKIPHNLVIVGEGSLRSQLEQKIAQLSLTNRVFLRGWVDDTIPYYVSCSVFATASYWEGLPNAVLEAMASGVPVVSTRTTSWIDIFARKTACLSVPVRDIKSLAQGILSLITEEELAFTLIRNSHEIIQMFERDLVLRERNIFLEESLQRY